MNQAPDDNANNDDDDVFDAECKTQIDQQWILT